MELKAEVGFCLSPQKQEQVGGAEQSSSQAPGPAGEGREWQCFSTDTRGAADQPHLLSGTLAKAPFSLWMSIPKESHSAKYGYLRAVLGSVSSCCPANG